MTGWTTGPHVHWAVQMDETWVNPRLFLPRRAPGPLPRRSRTLTDR